MLTDPRVSSCRIGGQNSAGWPGVGQGTVSGFLGPSLRLRASATVGECRAYFDRLQDLVGSGSVPWMGWIAYELGSLADPAITTLPMGPEEILAEFFPVETSTSSVPWGQKSGEPDRPIQELLNQWRQSGIPAAGRAATQSRTSYLRAVEEILRGIHAGDWYEVNLTTRFEMLFDQYPDLVEEAVRTVLDPTYGAVLHAPEYSLISASPELFLRRRGDVLVTRPIKGSAVRGQDGELDQTLLSELSNCPKNAAEHLMVVDLARNDLGRLCRPGTVRVREYKLVETHPAVHHLVSTIDGQLKSSVSLWNTLQAMWPAASITGCPKVAVTRVLARLEPGPRGVYTGSIGVLFPDGDFQFNVAIRTLAITSTDEGRYRVVAGSGGAIVADSNPEQEWQECLMKVAPLLGLLEQSRSAGTNYRGPQCVPVTTGG